MQGRAVPVPAVAAELPLTLCSPSASSPQGKGLGVPAAVGDRGAALLHCVGLAVERQGRDGHMEFSWGHRDGL